MTTRAAAINTAVQELSASARRKLGEGDVITDEVRALSDLRGMAGGYAFARDPRDVREEIRGAREALLQVIQRFRDQAGVVMNARAGSEKRAELLLIIGGIIVLALPVVSIVANVSGTSIGWGENLLNGLTAVGFMALMFGPGREIRRAAKDRTVLLLLPIGFEARVTAASTMEELQTIAADLQTTISGLSAPDT